MPYLALDSKFFSNTMWRIIDHIQLVLSKMTFWRIYLPIGLLCKHSAFKNVIKQFEKKIRPNYTNWDFKTQIYYVFFCIDYPMKSWQPTVLNDFKRFVNWHH